MNEDYPSQIGTATASQGVISASQLDQLLTSLGAMTTALRLQQESAVTPTATTPKPSKSLAEHPRIHLNSNEGRWAFFINEWHLFKGRARLPESCPEELRSCCSEELRHDLFNYVGGNCIDTLDEVTLLEHIKNSGKRNNKVVHRQEFYAQCQDPDMPAQ